MTEVPLDTSQPQIAGPVATELLRQAYNAYTHMTRRGPNVVREYQRICRLILTGQFIEAAEDLASFAADSNGYGAR